MSEHEILQWIELAEGDALQACQLSDYQRRQVLTILYAYRACYFQRGVTPQDIGIFFRLVAEAAMGLDDHEPADAVLEDITDYIGSVFPAVRVFFLCSAQINSQMCFLGRYCSDKHSYRYSGPTASRFFPTSLSALRPSDV